jgi:acyl-CoA thioesterase-1
LFAIVRQAAGMDHHRPKQFAATARSTASLLARTLALAAAGAASLLTFPAGVSWMIACWLTAISLKSLRGRDTRPLVAACTAIVLLKGVEWRMPLVVAALAAVCLAIVSRKSVSNDASKPGRLRRYAALAGLWLAWLWFAWDRHAAGSGSQTRPLDGDRPVVLLGDSLTAGINAGEGCALPLSRLVAPQVVDLSSPGLTVAAALKKLPQLDALRPGIVVVELGGNDFMLGRPREDVRRDLEQIVLKARRSGAEVVLVAAPRGLVRDPYYEVELSLARQYDLQLVHDGVFRSVILLGRSFPLGRALGPPYLTDDGLHPNRHGSLRVADAIADALCAAFGDSIVRKP